MSLTTGESSNEAKRSNPRPRAGPFERTLKAGRALWDAKGPTWDRHTAFADALYHDCGPSGLNGQHNAKRSKQLRLACAALANAGTPFVFDYVRQMCRFAQVFPPGVRTPGLSVAAHLKAGNPETVGAVIDALEKAPEDITVKDVRDFLEQRKLERERNNRAAHDKLKDRPPTSDLAYLDRLNRYFAAIAKASELVDTSMPKPKSDSDRQRIRNALTEVIDKCNKKLAAA